MELLGRAVFVVGAIVAVAAGLNYFVFGNSGDFRSQNTRMGEWRKATIREACFPALTNPERDRMAPQLPSGQHRVSANDPHRAQELTVALNCYVVTHAEAICDPHNRAYIVDYIGKYFAKKDEMLAVSKRHGQPEVNNWQEVWGSPRNRNIDNMLAHDIRNGRLNKADFGWSAPAAIGPLLDQHRNAGDTCPKPVVATLPSQNRQ